MEEKSSLDKLIDSHCEYIIQLMEMKTDMAKDVAENIEALAELISTRAGNYFDWASSETLESMFSTIVSKNVEICFAVSDGFW